MRNPVLVSVLLLLLARSAPAEAADYAIHVGGVCSTGFTDALGSWDGVVSVDATVDQRHDMATATADLRAVLDTYCTGDDWCYVFTFSNGAAVVSRVLSTYASEWNLYWVLASAGNEGGSELGDSGWAEVFGYCALADEVGPTAHRAGWNHHDTGGVTFYQIGGKRCSFPWVQCAFLPGEDDGAVAFHSAGGLADVSNTDSLCHETDAHFAAHHTVWSCAGYALSHAAMKRIGICELGGCD